MPLKRALTPGPDDHNRKRLSMDLESDDSLQLDADDENSNADQGSDAITATLPMALPQTSSELSIAAPNEVLFYDPNATPQLMEGREEFSQTQSTQTVGVQAHPYRMSTADMLQQISDLLKSPSPGTPCNVFPPLNTTLDLTIKTSGDPNGLNYVEEYIYPETQRNIELRANLKNDPNFGMTLDRGIVAAGKLYERVLYPFSGTIQIREVLYTPNITDANVHNAGADVPMFFSNAAHGFHDGDSASGFFSKCSVPPEEMEEEQCIEEEQRISETPGNKKF